MNSATQTVLAIGEPASAVHYPAHSRRPRLTATLPATLAHPALAQFGGWGGGSSGTGYSGYGGSGDGDGDSGLGFGSGAGLDYNTAMRRRAAHGIMATIAFVILFPLGAIFLRVIPGRWSVRIHYFVQILAWLLYIVGFALGVVLLRMIPSQGGESLVSGYLGVLPASLALIAGSGCVLRRVQADTGR